MGAYEPLLLMHQTPILPERVRNHRELGVSSSLFTSSIYSPGSPLFLPNGAYVFNRLVSFLRAQYALFGFREVVTPTMYKKSLWEKSGHWENYADDMYEVTGRGARGTKNDAATEQDQDEEFGLKPMNCPGHCLLFGSEKRSYRDLPIRYADFSPLHRNEISGALSGLTRVRRFHQDDGHIFCRSSQILEEISNTLRFISMVYDTFKLGPYKLVLSTRPKDQYIGTTSEWNRAEAQLREALDASGREWSINDGDGAFYGPKIDIILKDSDGKEHQTATVQLDFQLPQRFELSYDTPELGTDRPVLIHRAILGSLERFMALLIEHYNGRFPFWIAPRPCIVLSVTDRDDVKRYAKHVQQTLSGLPFYEEEEIQPAQLNDVHIPVDIDTSARRLQKKILEAKNKGYNHIVVIGPRDLDIAPRTVTIEVHAQADAEDAWQILIDNYKLNIQKHLASKIILFNFAVVMDEKEDSAAWEMVVRRLARLMRSLEEQGGFLSKEELEDEDASRVSVADSGHELGHKTPTRRVYALCEMIMEDLNNYSECMIPIDGSNTLNLKLFPPRPPPPQVYGWHVPLAIVRLSALQTSTWDLTISQIIPHINGTNSVHVISQLADTDFTLTRKAIQHLLYYHCILLLDIFQFSAIYAPTPEISLFLTDESMQEECRRYVTLPDSSRSDVALRPQRSHSPDHDLLSSPTTSSSPSSMKPTSIPQTARPSTPEISNAASISGSAAGGAGGAGAPSLDSLLTLYTSLKQGLTVKAWCIENAQLLGRVDIRRFITFGVIKGFLYRVHKYAVTGQVPTPPKGAGVGRSQAEGEKGRDGVGAVGKREREREKEKEQDAFRKAATSSGWATPGEGQSGITAGLKSLSLRHGGDGSVAKGDAGSVGEREGERQEYADSAEVRSSGSPKKNEREFLPLARYLDGLHCFDEICSELKMSEREIVGKLRGYGEVCVIHR
ncbi:MAG: hypothetical protein Q9165_007058 [Trypethelium subeluteriae]